MNEFVEQFLIEARELVDQATDDLLALEERPNDHDRLNSAFRAFHTLKGSAAIVDFDAMARALHAGEDVLSGLRQASAPVTADLIGDCLLCLDQVVEWLDAMEATGEIPEGAQARADAVIARFGRLQSRADVAVAGSPAASADTGWVDDLRANFADKVAQAVTAVRYKPDPQCFFRGHDPAALVEAFPGLIALRLASDEPPGELAALDPFVCGLVITLLSDASADEARAALADADGEVEVVGLSRMETGLSEVAMALIDAQLALLSISNPDGLAGRLGAAGRAAANVLRSRGAEADAQEVDRATTQSRSASDGAALINVLRRLVGRDFVSDPASDPGAEPQRQETVARVLRVDIARIDALVRLTGELTVAKSAVGHIVGLLENGADPKAAATGLKAQHRLLDRLVGELQRSVLGIRVLPLSHVFQRFPRLVRDMGISLGRPLNLSIEGGATEADKAIVESLFEPLLHVLRNAVDHGVETPEARARTGKPATATLGLRAYRQGEHVIVEVEDDGQGVDIARVKAIAGARGLVGAEALKAMTDEAAIDLIFAPGFSTAAAVSELSGRGVGMDAVRTAIERLGGRVSVQSEVSRGARVRFILPFTVMMSRLMTVEAGGQAFGIPLDAVLETVKIPRDQIQPIGAARAFVYRNQTVPICDLATMLAVDAARAPGPEATIVVATTGGQLTGLEVDQVGARMDIMLKPLDGLLSGAPGISGTTLLGDGRVLIVLDLEDLLQ